MHLITGFFTIIFPCKILVDWLTLFDRARDGARDLKSMEATANRWIFRHLSCALLAVLLIVGMQHSPDLHGDDPLPRVTAIYVAFTLLCAFAESLLAQSITCLSRK